MTKTEMIAKAKQDLWYATVNHLDSLIPHLTRRLNTLTGS